MAESAIITMDLTRAGFELYGKINAGLTPLHITRVVIGDGYLAEGETIYDLAAVKHEVSNVTVQIVSVENLGDGRSRMLIRITGHNEDFYLREIAVMAEDPDNGEIMYSGCNYGDMADYVMTYAGAAPVMQEGNIYFITGTGDLTVEVSHDNVSVTHAEFEAHTDDKENPHNVTAEQIFPDNAATLKTITAQDKENYDAASEVKHTHENKSVLDTITQALITGWNNAVSHITNKSNPHSVTKAQVGLGNVTNESKATMFTSPNFTGTPTAVTPASSNNSNRVATTAFVMNAIEDLKKLIGNAYIADTIRSVDIEVCRVQNWGHSEYRYCLITCIGCTLKNGDYISNSDPKYTKYSKSSSQDVDSFYVCIDPETLIVTPMSEITLNSGIFSIKDENVYPNSSAYIDPQNSSMWTDESQYETDYAEYFVYHTTITL